MEWLGFVGFPEAGVFLFRALGVIFCQELVETFDGVGWDDFCAVAGRVVFGLVAVTFSVVFLEGHALVFLVE